MKKFLLIAFFLYSSFAFSQDKIELSPNGFPTVTIAKPNIPLESLIEASRSWALFYNKKGADVYEVTSTSLKIDALKPSAFHYYSLGDPYFFTVKYTLAVEFGDQNYTLKFTIKEIYMKDKLIESTIADYFTAEGKMKQGFEEIKPSLENTVNKMVNSFARFIAK